MSDKHKHEVQHVHKKEYDGNRDTELVEHLGGHTDTELKGSGKNQSYRRKHQHRRLRTRPCHIEMLLGMAEASGQHGSTKHQQNIPDY